MVQILKVLFVIPFFSLNGCGALILAAAGTAPDNPNSTAQTNETNNKSNPAPRPAPSSNSFPRYPTTGTADSDDLVLTAPIGACRTYAAISDGLPRSKPVRGQFECSAYDFSRNQYKKALILCRKSSCSMIGSHWWDDFP